MKRILLIIISALILVSCSKVNVVDDVEINQIKSNYPIILIPRQEDRTIWAIVLPLAFTVRKKVFREIDFRDPYYMRIDKFGELVTTNNMLYLKEGDSLIFPHDNDKRRFLQFTPKEWVIYVRISNLSKEQDVQTFFASALKRAELEHKDTLHIGSIQQLKHTNPGFLNDLLQRDSIKFRFFFEKNFHGVTLPVEIK